MNETPEGLQNKANAFVLPFESIRKEDTALVGGKCANLGELISIGVPVPPGFAVTATAYKYFIESTGLQPKIMELLEKLDINDVAALRETSRRIRELMESTPLPRDLEEAIKKAYRELAERLSMKDPPVAVRSSATAEDLLGASFAGQQETFLFVRGEDEVVRYVQKCFSSLFTARAIAYREEKGFRHEKVYLSVAVQKMVNSKAAGVMFTINPVNGDPSVVVIEGAWGVGETVVGGKVTPDEYVVRKSDFKILEKKISKKLVMAVGSDKPGSGGYIEEKEVPPELQEAPCLTDEQIVTLARYAVKIEQHYQHPQDIEWALDSDTEELYIVQSRPETVWSLKEEAAKPKVEVAKVEKKILVRGLPASPGIAAGKAHVITDVSKISEFKRGEILVTVMTSPDWAPAMRMAKAIVTDSGGMTSHAAIVSRELGIPCIVGTGNATKVLKTGMDITVDATQGVVYEGVIEEERPPAPAITPKVVELEKALVDLYPPTGTKIYMNLGEPDAIDKYLHLPFDGIGLMRIEFIIADVIGEHPLYLIEIGKPEKFVDLLAEGIAKVARAIYPRPVVVRFSDFKTNEYRRLKGGEKYEPAESNPMLGWRGVSRYISPQYRPAFRLELRAIKKVREEMGLKNVWVMFPFARAPWELEKALELMKEEGLERGRDFKVWVMAEVPSVIFLADEFCKYVDGFSIGSNDLTQLTLGVDRDSELLPSLDPRYFDERDPAVLRAIAHLIEVAHKHEVTVSICGQGPSVYPELTEFLVRCGIDSVSVNPDAVISARRLVASVERKILLESTAPLSKSNRPIKDFALHIP
ncbi:MAG: phosphoenolpyruvate synthase [Candidatus Verstraetearchaeota archaeon]|nr:phosphoenolpyruvate synthase [Candidatus Verstraetearchaeota archaeon]